MRLEMVVLGLEGTEEALDHCAVKAAPFATPACVDSAGWTIGGLILKSLGVLHQNAVGHVRER